MSFLFFVFRRLALLLPTLFGVSVIGFLLAYLLPGNPALVKAGPMATPQYVVEMKHKMGLDQPVYVQYARYATGLLHGDLGESSSTGRPVLTDFLQRLPATLELALLAAMFVISRYVLPLLERRDRGATGEEQVGGLLDELAGSEWRVIHDASLGRGNVDHILIGPGGVFTVETKSHPGPVRVGTVHGATLSQAQAQRKAIERVTGIKVEPLVVFSRAWVDRPLVAGSRAVAQVSAHGRPVPCTLAHNDDTDIDAMEVIFDDPQRPVAPGQTVALYDALDPDAVVGAGIAA